MLAGAWVATAVAVSVYGLYQAGVELPRLQEQFLRNPKQILEQANLSADPQRLQALKNRLLDSNEIFATFGLANSLAGFLVGPLVLLVGVIIQNLSSANAKGSRAVAIGLAAGPLLCILTCLILTKSRSAYIGLVVALAVLAWRSRGHVPPRLLYGFGLGVAVMIVALAAAGLATGRLDREVVTQSPMSLRYRWEYWQGAWGVITDGASTLRQALSATPFWAGVGPGNFGHHYLKYKLPQASEEIQDPHNLVLEVWSVAGCWAMIALVCCPGACPVEPAGARRVNPTEADDSRERSQPSSVSRETELAPPPTRLGWLVLSRGPGAGDGAGRW